MNKGKKLYEGKAKIIYETNDKNLLIQHFKDDATAFNNLKKASVEGKGVLNNRISEHILNSLSQCGIKTHLIKRLNMREQLIKHAEIIPIEFIVRNIATGSLSKRLGIADGTILEKPLFEYCYKDDESQLPYNHLKNLDKLKRNIPLEEIKGVCPPPGYESSPLESSKYFDKIYGSNNEFKIASHLNSQTGPIMAYNNDEYSEFSQNLDVQGTSSYIRNCDIGLKKTSKELNDFVFPKDSNNLEETEKNKIYFQKNVEI